MSRILVVPFTSKLPDGIKGWPVYLRLAKLEDLNKAFEAISKAGAKIAGVLVENDKPLARQPLSPELAKVPLITAVPEVGTLKELMAMLPVLTKLQLQVQVPAHSTENLIHVRILSSLGVRTGLVLSSNGTLWDELEDLMYYSLFRMVPGGPIHPFAYLQSKYQPAGQTDYSGVYLDDPRQYLHMNGDGKIALTHADLENGNFIDVELDKIKSGLDSVEDYWRYLGRWKKHFLDQNSCSKCEGWRICLGKFAEVAEEGSCRKFFTALLNNLDTMLDKKGGLKQNANVNP